MSLMQNPLALLVPIFVVEGMGTGDEFIEDDAAAEDFGPLIARPARNLLRGGVNRSAEDDLRTGQEGAKAMGDPNIEDLYDPIRLDENVARPDFAAGNSSLVRVPQTLRDLGHNGQLVFLRDGCFFSQQRAQASPLQVLHHDI